MADVETMHRRVSNVTATPLGSETSVAGILADTVVYVENATDFDQTGGWVLIDSVPYEYTTREDGEDDDAPAPSITLAAPGLLGAVPAGTPVQEYDPDKEQVIIDYMVEVTDDIDASAGEAYLHHSLIPLLPEGTPVGVGDSVEVTVDEYGDWTVTNIFGRQAVLDITSASGKNTIQWSTEEPPALNPDAVIGDLWWQRGLADDGVTPTDTIIGLWRWDGSVWEPQQLTSSTIAYLDAGVITTGIMTGRTVQTRSDPLKGVKIGYIGGQEGLFVYNEITGEPFLKAVPAEGMAVIAGEVKARTLTVSSDDPLVTPGSSLGGTTEIATGGRILLTGGTTAPSSAPVATYGYDTVQFAPVDSDWASNRTAWAANATNSYTWNSRTRKFEKWDAAGNFVFTPATGGFGSGVTVRGIAISNDGAYIYSIVDATSAVGAWIVYRHSTTTLDAVDSVDWLDADGTRWPTIGIDTSSGELLIAQSRPTNSSKVRIRRYTYTPGTPATLTPGTSVNTDLGWDANLVGVILTAADFGATRYVLTNPTAANDIRTTTTGGVFQTAEYWPSGTTDNKLGIAYYGSTFYLMDKAGVRRAYTGNWSLTASDMTKWVSNTLAQGAGPTYQTTQSPRSKIVMANRSKLSVTTSPIAAGGDADRVRIFVGKGTTDPGRTQMALQSAPGAGDTTESYSTLVAPPGTNPPSSNNFPDAAGSSVDGPTGIYIKSDGTVPAGVYAEGVKSAVGIRTINTQAGTAYTLALTDIGDVIELTNAGGAVVVTVPANGTIAFPVGSEIDVYRQNTSTVTFTAEVGATIVSRGGALTIPTRYGRVTLHKRATNTWLLSGDI